MIKGLLLRDAGCHCEVDGNCVQGYSAASSRNVLPTFRDNEPVPFQASRVQKESRSSQPTNRTTKQLNFGWLVGWLLGPYFFLDY
jgi:hypothetical protein